MHLLTQEFSTFQLFQLSPLGYCGTLCLKQKKSTLRISFSHLMEIKEYRSMLIGFRFYLQKNDNTFANLKQISL